MRIKPAPIRVACGQCTHFVLEGNGITKKLILIHFLTHVLEVFRRMTTDPRDIILDVPIVIPYPQGHRIEARHVRP
jgi:hypothetical protein